MKGSIKLVVLILLMLGNATGYSQKHTYNWYFAQKAGLNFNTTPPQVLSNGNAPTIEGSSSISDNNGQLLFYSNGITIMNRLHQQMKNGGEIMGNTSSTCNSVIVPSPAGDGIYYLFTVGAAFNDIEGFRYTVIDMKRENGLGEVMQKNVEIESNVFEKLAAVRHCNKKDVWVTVRRWNSDVYATYLVTATGVSTSPVLSNSGYFVGGADLNSLGALKFSPDGSKLVALHSFENDAAELMSFNNTTGDISVSLVFKPNVNPPAQSYMGVYGAEFSPDSRLLYISSNLSDAVPAILYQFDITSMFVPVISGSKYIVCDTGPFRGGALQAAPDGKIYMTRFGDSSLSVINNPDLPGAASGFRYNEILVSNTGGQQLQAGLPFFIAGDMDAMHAPADFAFTGNCNSGEVSFAINNITGVDSVRWDFGDGNVSNSFAPVHQYNNTSTFPVTLTLFKPGCGTNQQVITHEVSFADRVEKFLPGDTSLCLVKDLDVAATVESSSYLWNTGDITPALMIQHPGLYWLEVMQNGCLTRDSIIITLSDPVTVNIGKDTTVCADKKVTIDALVNGTYLWSTGETSRSIEIKQAGEYWVKVSNGGCAASDTLKASWGDCNIFIPSAFSPNGDGINDHFSLTSGIRSESFSFTIYNRYGQTVFQGRDPLQRWDGTFLGKAVPMGVYPWYLFTPKTDTGIS